MKEMATDHRNHQYHLSTEKLLFHQNVWVIFGHLTVYLSLTVKKGYNLPSSKGCVLPEDDDNLSSVSVQVNSINPNQDGNFWGSSRMGGQKGLLYLKPVTHILKWWNMARLPYLQKIQNIYQSRDTFFEFC